jgi:protein KTI12
VAEEKKARGALLSAVERLLNRDTIVIADALNYVKGFRYQLYCVARAVSTPHCTVSYSDGDVCDCCEWMIDLCLYFGQLYCGVPVDLARRWNEERDPQQAYTPQV